MTPIDKVIKALELTRDIGVILGRVKEDSQQDAVELDGKRYAGPVAEMMVELVRSFTAAADASVQALADLSPLKLEEGDVEVACELLRSDRYRNPTLGHPSSRPGMFAHNARIDRLLAFLGHGGEGCG